jgi:glycosyltransferase involved in cell wall biosynthesis
MNRNDNSATLPTLSVVVPCFNEAEGLANSLARLSDTLNELISSGLVSRQSFIYCVDDGSSDATWSLIEAGREKYGHICGARLSRNFGHQSALTAGLMAVKDRSDISISIDADLQQDPAAMKDFVIKYLEGAEVVFGVRNDRATDTLMKKITANSFYRLMALCGVKIIANHADYRLLSQKAMNALSEHTEQNLFLRAICAQLGFKQATVMFDVRERTAGTTKYSLTKMLSLALSGITSFSVAPLRAIAMLGALIFCISTAMACFVLFKATFTTDTVPGWASTVLPIYFIGGIQILCLGIIGEYVAQALIGIKKRPRYIVDKELF